MNEAREPMMKRTLSRATILAGSAILVCAFGLKLHYSDAGSDALGWILAPTAAGVELLTGVAFQAESGTGYFAPQRMFAITKSCAGVNFLIVAFVMLGLAAAWRARSGWATLRTTLLAACMAFAATVVANTLRIVVAMPLAHADPLLLLVDGESAHRLVGVIVYFGGLCLLYAVFVARRPPPQARGAWRHLSGLVPLGFYLGVTVAVPLLNGWLRGRPVPWSEHLTVLLIVPAALFVMGTLLCLGIHSRQKAPTTT